MGDEEEIVHWVRAKNPSGRGDGFVYLTEEHVVVHWRGRGESLGAIALQDIEWWGLDKDADGGPLLGLQYGEGSHVIQLSVNTQHMAEDATEFIRKFSEEAPRPTTAKPKSPELQGFTPDGNIAVQGKPRPLISQARRIGVTVLGVALIVVGIAITPLPGPWSFLINIAGLAILASEYDWAKDVLDWAREKYQAVKDKIGRKRQSST